MPFAIASPARARRGGRQVWDKDRLYFRGIIESGSSKGVRVRVAVKNTFKCGEVRTDWREHLNASLHRTLRPHTYSVTLNRPASSDLVNRKKRELELRIVFRFSRDITEF